MLFALAVPFTIANAAEWRIAGDYDVAFTTEDGKNYTATIPSVKEGTSFWLTCDGEKWAATVGGPLELGVGYTVGLYTSYYCKYDFEVDKDYSELIVTSHDSGYFRTVTINKGAGGGSDVEEETFTWSFSGKGNTWNLTDEDGDGTFTATGITISDSNYDGDYCIKGVGSNGTNVTYGLPDVKASKDENYTLDSDSKNDKINFGEDYTDVTVNWTPSTAIFCFNVEQSSENPNPGQDPDPKPDTDAPILIIYNANTTDSVKEYIEFTLNADGSYTANAKNVAANESFHITIDEINWGSWYPTQFYDDYNYSLYKNAGAPKFNEGYGNILFTLTSSGESWALQTKVVAATDPGEEPGGGNQGGGSDEDQETFTWSFSGKGNAWDLTDEDGDGVFTASGISITDTDYRGYIITGTGSNGTIVTYGNDVRMAQKDVDLELSDSGSKIMFGDDFSNVTINWNPTTAIFHFSIESTGENPALNKDIRLVIYTDTEAETVKNTLAFTENEGGIYTLSGVEKVYKGESFKIEIDSKSYGCFANTNVTKPGADFPLYDSNSMYSIVFSMNLTNPVFTVKYDDAKSTWQVSITWDVKPLADTTQLSTEIAGGSGSRNFDSNNDSHALQIPFTFDEDFINPEWYEDFNVEISLADEYAHLVDHKAYKAPDLSGKVVQDNLSPNTGYVGVNAYYAGVYNLKVSHPGVEDAFGSIEHTMTLTVKPTIESLGLVVNFSSVRKTDSGYELDYTPEFKFREDRDNNKDPEYDHNNVLFEVGSGYVGDPVEYDPEDPRFYWAHRDICQEAQKEAEVKFYYSYSRNPEIQPRDTQRAPGVVPAGYTLSKPGDYMDLKKALDTSNGFSLIVEENGIQSDPQWIEMGGIETGISSITSDADADTISWYDLQGNRVAAPAHGIYIRVKGNNHSKVLIP